MKKNTTNTYTININMEEDDIDNLHLDYTKNFAEAYNRYNDKRRSVNVRRRRKINKILYGIRHKGI